jgi:hypothetical protein
MSRSSSSSFHRVRDGTRSSSKGKAASPSTSAAGRPCAGAGVAASTRHSVAYRWRCAGASGRSARDLKPSSCALDCPSTPPRLRWRRPPRHLAEPLPVSTGSHGWSAPERGAQTEGTFCGTRSTHHPQLAGLHHEAARRPLQTAEASRRLRLSRRAHHSCKARRRGRPSGPACPLEPSVCAVALEPHACTSVKGSRKDAYSNPKQSHRKSNPV